NRERRRVRDGQSLGRFAGGDTHHALSLRASIDAEARCLLRHNLKHILRLRPASTHCRRRGTRLYGGRGRPKSVFSGLSRAMDQPLCDAQPMMTFDALLPGPQPSALLPPSPARQCRATTLSCSGLSVLITKSSSWPESPTPHNAIQCHHPRVRAWTGGDAL